MTLFCPFRLLIRAFIFLQYHTFDLENITWNKIIQNLRWFSILGYPRKNPHPMMEGFLNPSLLPDFQTIHPSGFPIN